MERTYTKSGKQKISENEGRYEQMSSPQPLGDFCKFFGKDTYFNAFESLFARFWSHLNELNF